MTNQHQKTMKFAWQAVKDADDVSEAAEGVGKTVMRGHGLSTGTFRNGETGERFVTVGGVILSSEHARIYARQINEWADYVDKINAEDPPIVPFLRYRLKGLVDKALEDASDVIAAKQALAEDADAELLKKRRDIANAKRRARYAKRGK